MANSYGNNHDSGRSVNGSSSFNGNNYINGNNVPPSPENSTGPLPMQHTTVHPTDWTAEEQAILEENLAKYASLPSIVRYAKIAVLLQNKTVRDVALRCRWMNRKENSKRRKEDRSLTRKSKDRKENLTDPPARSSHLAGLPSFYAEGVVTNVNDNGILYNGGITGQLLRQNAQALEQISANFRAFQTHENIGLFCQARDNILKILSNLRDTQDIMKQMPPLPVKLNEELADLILPRTTFPTETLNHDQGSNL